MYGNKSQKLIVQSYWIFFLTKFLIFPEKKQKWDMDLFLFKYYLCIGETFPLYVKACGEGIECMVCYHLSLYLLHFMAYI